MMHPKIVFPGELKPIFDDLARPMHTSCHRDPKRTCAGGSEASLAEGYALDVGDFKSQPHLDVLLDDLRRFMLVVMEIRETAKGYPIRLHRARPQAAPPDAAEAHGIRVSESGCDIEAADMDALRRALYRLQDEMLIRRAPLLPLGETTRWTTIGTRIIRCPVAPYRWLSGWELEDDNDYYPEAYLNRVAHSGINGLWIPGLLRNLVASKTIPELGPPKHRLEKIKAIIAKGARYGIRIYLFCIEPRALPEGHPAIIAHPEIVGARNSLCPSEPLVLEYVREVMQNLFTEVPDLAGVINIFCGERPTTCWMNSEYVQECPRCRQRLQADALAETLNAFVDGIHAAGSKAEFMAWTYSMDSARETKPITIMLDAVDKSHRDVIWLGNFEHGSVKELCGKKVTIHEYSLSCPGPSDYFVEMATETRKTNHRVYAKLQIGTSYEMSSVTYVPVPGIEYAKLQAAEKLGATGAMMTWIPGGFPGPMLKAAGEAAFVPRPSKEEFLRRLAGLYWGQEQADRVAAAWECFAEAWQRYPFCNEVLYWGPITRGPAYQLHLEREERLAKPYNWGYTRKREPQPWEDRLSRWTGPYTVQEIIDSFRDMAERWRVGLEKLKAARKTMGDEPEMDRQIAVASAVRLQCLAAANVYEFYVLRDRLLETDASEHPAILRRMQAVARDDIQVARDMRDLLSIEPTLGFEAEIYDFSYSKSLLNEKILQIGDVLPMLEQWEKFGIDPVILKRTVEEAEWLRPDRNPDRWGD